MTITERHIRSEGADVSARPDRTVAGLERRAA
jgi:hypothetical protein